MIRNETARRMAAKELADLLATEGLFRLGKALRGGGLTDTSLWTGMRMCISGELEAIKVRGRWMTSIAAVRRMLARQALQSRSATLERGSVRSASKAAAGRYLESLGLGRKTAEERGDP